MLRRMLRYADEKSSRADNNADMSGATWSSSSIIPAAGDRVEERSQVALGSAKRCADAGGLEADAEAPTTRPAPKGGDVGPLAVAAAWQPFELACTAKRQKGLFLLRASTD